MRALALALAVMAVPVPARASVADVLGMGAEVMSMAGAGAALQTGPWAAHHNPAGLALAGSDVLSVGVVGMGSELEIRGLPAPIEDPVGILAGFSLVRRLPGRVVTSIGFAVAGHSLPGSLGHVHQRTPETPFFLCYDNRTQRAMLVPALAVGLGRHVAVGLGIDVFAGLEGPITAKQGQSGRTESSVFVDIVTRLRPTPSITVRPGAGLSLSLTYHPEFGVPYDLDVEATVPGLELIMHMRGLALYTPHALVLGAAWSHERARVALDLAWSAWSRLGSPFVEVEARILEIGLLAPANPRVEMHDTVSVRVGVEGTVLSTGALELVVRGGYGYESPVVGEQTGRSNLMDGHKHTAALGLGTAWSTGRGPLSRVVLDLHVGAIVVTSLTHHKVVSDPAEGRDDPTLIVDEDETTPGVQVSNPGYPSITGGGWIATLGATLTLELR